MLKGIDPLLTPDLLRALAAMGHNEWVALVDANFTGERLAKQSTYIRLPGIDLVRAARAILSVMPLAKDVPAPIAYMHHSGETAEYRTSIQGSVIDVAKEFGFTGSEAKVEVAASPDLRAVRKPNATEVALPIERFAFYEQMPMASVVVQTGEMSAYGNILLCKGFVSAG